MQDWNVVVSVHEAGFVRACTTLQRYGRVKRTEYYNVLVMKVPDTQIFLEALRAAYAEDPFLARLLARVLPVAHTFTFQNAAEFEARAREAVSAWLPALAGKSFHVRMHRRGFKGALSSQEEERLLNHFLLEALAQAGTLGRITFEDPDAILALETVGQRAGLSCWTRESLQRYPFLHLD